METESLGRHSRAEDDRVLVSMTGVRGLEPRKGSGKAVAASGQKVSQEWTKKKLLDTGHARGKLSVIESSDRRDTLTQVTESQSRR